MTIFAPAPTYPAAARGTIDRAYVTAGLAPITNVDAIGEALAAEPAVHTVAHEFAEKALNGTVNTAELIEEAIEKIRRAQAIASITDIYTRVVDAVAMEHIEEARAKAVTDLTPAFNKLTKKLATAAAKLDQKDPLSVDLAYEHDATVEHKTVLGILATLGQFVIHPAHSPEHRLNQILPIVTVADVDRQKVVRTVNGPVPVSRADDNRKKRSAIRTLIRDYEKDPDRALTHIAQGKYEGIAFELATAEEIIRRATAVTNATTYEPVSESEAN